MDSGFYPHLTAGDQAEAFRSLVAACPFKEVHWVADAWFTSDDNISSIPPGGCFTFSISSCYSPELWSALSVSLPVDRWRAVSDGARVASCHTASHVAANRQRSVVCQKLLSSAWAVFEGPEHSDIQPAEMGNPAIEGASTMPFYTRRP